MLLWDNKFQRVEPTLVSQTGRGPAPKTVELIVVRVSGQPFGLLLKQVFNIARPEGDNFSVLRPTDPEKGFGEVYYRGQILRVVDLARKLQLPAGEALADSKILVSGRLTSTGTIRLPFGVSVDEIIGVWHISLENLRLLDEWICRKRLGRLLWGIALVDRANFGMADQSGEVQPTSQFTDLMGETGLLASSTRPDRIGLAGMLSLEESRQARSGNAAPSTIPLMLLDLEVLRAELTDSNSV